MKKKPAGPVALTVTSVKLNPDLADAGHALARKNKRDGRKDLDAFYKILNAALADYLKKHG